jgi:hypothetical protein
MDAFFENARRIFEVAKAGSVGGESSDFALLIGADGGLHFVMESPFFLDGETVHGARSAYRVTRSGDGVRVEGRSGAKDCILEERTSPARTRQLLRDQPLYRIASPVLTS